MVYQPALKRVVFVETSYACLIKSGGKKRPKNNTWGDDVEEVFERIHPNFRQAPVVLVDNLSGSARKSVRRRFAEDVAHVRTRHNEQSAAALPDLLNKVYSTYHLQQWAERERSFRHCFNLL